MVAMAPPSVGGPIVDLDGDSEGQVPRGGVF